MKDTQSNFADLATPFGGKLIFMANATHPISTIYPVAIGKGSLAEVWSHLAPDVYDQDRWGDYTCECGAVFSLFGNLHYAPREDQYAYAEILEKHLAKEHKADRPHRKIYHCDPLRIDQAVEIPN